MPTNNINNNDNNQELSEWEHMFYMLFYKFTVLYVKTCPRSLRRVIEFLFLLKAVMSFFLLVYVHMNFLRMPVNCLDHVKGVWPRDGILRVEVIRSYQRSHAEQIGTINELFTVEKSYERQYKLKLLDTNDENASLFNHFIKTNNPKKKGEVIIEPSVEELVENKFQETAQKSPKPSLFNYLSFTNYLNFEDEKKEMFSSTTKANRHTTNKSNYSLEEESVQFCSTKYPNSSIRGVSGIDTSSLFQSASTKSPPIDENDVIFYENYIVEYSLVDGFLNLLPSDRYRLGIPVMLVALEPTRNKCFGNSISQFFLEYFLGYDDLLVSSVKSLDKYEQNKGFMRNVITGKSYGPNTIWLGRMLQIVSFFRTIVIAVSLSVLLRFNFRQIFFIILDIQQELDSHGSLTIPVAPCFTLLMSLIGLCGFMMQFFEDFFMLNTMTYIVFAADIFYFVLSYYPMTKRHWLKFFYLYYLFFYVWVYRFDGQYSYLALICSWIFIQHSMVYFYHHYELPYVLRHEAQRYELMIRHEQQHQHEYEPDSGDISMEDMQNHLSRLRAELHSMVYFYHHYELPYVLRHEAQRYELMIRHEQQHQHEYEPDSGDISMEDMQNHLSRLRAELVGTTAEAETFELLRPRTMPPPPANQ